MKNLEKRVHIINKLLKKSAECTCGTTMVFLVFGESKTKQKNSRIVRKLRYKQIDDVLYRSTVIYRMYF